MEEKIINEAMEMTKGVPGKDVLVPLAQEEKENCPYPQVEYKIIEAPTMDKLVRDVNNHLANGRVCDGGVQITSGIIRFYQSMERWIVPSDFGLKSEMPIENSEAGTMGPIAAPLGEGMKFLENEPDLYEDITKDAIN